MHLAYVPLQVCLHGEPFLAQRAFIRPFARMRSKVHLQVGTGPERLGTPVTLEVLLARVQFCVQVQGVLPGKLLLAHVARELVLVDGRVLGGHVVVQISLLPKTLRTAGVGTVVGPFLQVDPQVHVQRGLGEEHLITVFALDLATLVRGLVVL